MTHEVKNFTEQTTSSEVKFASDSGYLHATLEVLNFGREQITISDIVLGVTYERRGQTDAFINDVPFRRGQAVATPGGSPSVNDNGKDDAIEIVLAPNSFGVVREQRAGRIQL